VGSYGRSGSAVADARPPFLWFHWAGASFTERKLKAVPKNDEELTLLEVEAAETKPPEGKAPRKVKLTLTARRLPSK
jgi:hypothetical protein